MSQQAQTRPVWDCQFGLPRNGQGWLNRGQWGGSPMAVPLVVFGKPHLIKLCRKIRGVLFLQPTRLNLEGGSSSCERAFGQRWARLDAENGSFGLHLRFVS